MTNVSCLGKLFVRQTTGVTLSLTKEEGYSYLRVRIIESISTPSRLLSWGNAEDPKKGA